MPDARDPVAVAKEALALAAKASHAPWWDSMLDEAEVKTIGWWSSSHTVDAHHMPVAGVRKPEDAALIRHAGTHYAAVAAALLASHAALERARAVLREIEYGVMGECPSCARMQPGIYQPEDRPRTKEGHAPDCALAALLAAPTRGVEK